MLSAKKPKLAAVECARISPNPLQPRRNFDADKLRGLADSIAANGLLQPVSVRRVAGGYQLIAGERRLRAAKLAGLGRIPCVVLDSGPAESGVLALVENLQRQDLDCFEQAEGIARLLECDGATQADCARQIGLSQPAVANKLRLLAYGPEDRERMRAAGLTERHARALLAVKDPGLRSEALSETIARGLTVAETERLAEKLQNGCAAEPAGKVRGALRDLRAFDNSLRDSLRLLRQCGMEAEFSRRTQDGCTEYVIRITAAAP